MNTNDDGCRLRFRSKWQLSVCHMRKIYLKKENSIASNILSSHTRTHAHTCSVIHKLAPSCFSLMQDMLSVSQQGAKSRWIALTWPLVTRRRCKWQRSKYLCRLFFFFPSFSFELHVFLPRSQISSFLRITEAQTSSACFFFVVCFLPWMRRAR